MPGAGKPGRWVALVAAVVIVVVLLVVGLRGSAIGEFLWGYPELERLFSNEAQVSQAWAKVWATIVWSLYVTASIYLPWRFLRIFIWRANLKWLAIASCALAANYLPTLLLRAVLTTDVCVRKDGTTDKWYVETPDRRIVLYDSPGFDALGNQKVKANSGICRRWALQQSARQPHRVQFQPDLQFFSGAGASLVWYYRGPDGAVELFDSEGYHPATGVMLQPADSALYETLRRDYQKKKQEDEDLAKKARRDAEEAAEQQRRLAEERQIREQREAELRRKTEEDSRARERQAAEKAAEIAKKAAEEKARQDQLAVEVAKKRAEAKERTDKCRPATQSKCREAIREISVDAVNICQTMAECEPSSAEAWSLLGRAQLMRKQYDAAEGSFDKQLKIGSQVRDGEILARSYTNLGDMEKGRGALDRAEAFYLKGIELSAERPSIRGVAHSGLSEVYMKRGEISRAESHLLRAVDLLKQSDNKVTLGTSYIGLALVSMSRRDRRGACANWQYAHSIFSELGIANRIEQTQKGQERAGCI